MTISLLLGNMGSAAVAQQPFVRQDTCQRSLCTQYAERRARTTVSLDSTFVVLSKVVQILVPAELGLFVGKSPDNERLVICNECAQDNDRYH